MWLKLVVLLGVCSVLLVEAIPARDYATLKEMLLKKKLNEMLLESREKELDNAATNLENEEKRLEEQERLFEEKKM